MATIPASENEFPEVLFAEGAAPATPATGLVKAYAKADGLLYSKDDAGAETALSGAAASAAIAAHEADATDAHDASAVSYDDTGNTNVTGANVQAALDAAEAAIAAGGAATSEPFVTYSSTGGLSAERVVATPASGGAIPYLVRKTADETVNNSSVLQNDDHLLYALAASEEIMFECDIWYSSGATPDMKATWTVPAGAAIMWSTTGFDTGGSSHNDSFLVQASGTTLDYSGSTTPQRHARMKGQVINGANAGNLQLQWAQNTANASDTKVLKNSILRVWKLA